jgi:hypothetical protein
MLWSDNVGSMLWFYKIFSPKTLEKKSGCSHLMWELGPPLHMNLSFEDFVFALRFEMCRGHVAEFPLHFLQTICVSIHSVLVLESKYGIKGERGNMFNRGNQHSNSWPNVGNGSRSWGLG